MNTVDDDIKLFENSKDNLEYFSNQLSLIKDGYVRSFVESILLKIPRFEVERPTSSTGKYHPANQNLKAGNGRHTKALVKYLTVFARARPDMDWDCMYAAGILHDLLKYKDEDSLYTDKDHALHMSEFILKNADFNLFRFGIVGLPLAVILNRKEKFIAKLVRWHMGRFDPANSNKEQINSGDMGKSFKNIPFTEVYWIIHYADMMASSTELGCDVF